MTRRDRRNIFVLGLDDTHLRDVRDIPDAERFRIHPLLDAEEIVYLEEYPIEEKLEKARRILREFSGRVDAVIGHWDFPVSVMVPILCQDFGLIGPSLESVLKCEHKYWSRIEQRKALPECTPEFCAIDPFAERPLDQLCVDYPFWLKPIKAYGSALGFRVNDQHDFEHAIEEARRKIHRIGDPFNDVLARVARPPEVAGVGGNHMIAEGLIGGRELAPEGYVQHGQYHAHGVVDMVRASNRKSFLRYEYPSTAPRAAQQKVIDAAGRILAQIGFDNGCFNVEFFWDEHEDRLWVIEVNSRMSQSHSNLFVKVDGMSNHEVAIHVALGDEPRFEHGSGRYRHAAKFLHRRYDKSDAIVTRVPDEEDLERLHRRQPDTRVSLTLKPGMHLSELKDQDAYSYTLATLEIGAQSTHELNERYEEAARLLPFELEPVSEEGRARGAGEAG